MIDATDSLRGVKVLITRPAGQSAHLAGLVEARGGTALLLPLLTIRPLVLLPEALPDEPQDVLIFVSVNAVRHGLSQVRAAMKPGSITLGVGTATVSALKSAGLNPVAINEDSAGSEGLLQLSVLSEEAVRGHSVLIVRGEGGRELLGETLQQRGALVRHVETYRRMRVEVAIQATLAAAGVSKPDVIVLTSNEAADQLLHLMREQQAMSLRHCDTVVMSGRIAAHVHKLGFDGHIEVAAEASDEGIVAAVHRLAAAPRT